jgi:hypothetical protein
MASERLYYASPGFLLGITPNGERVVAGHEHPGRTGFVLYWKGTRYTWYSQEQLQRDFGIGPREKKTGGQRGYPSEPVLQAIWRHLVDRYNAGDSTVSFGSSPPPEIRGTNAGAAG